jgi:hypothetical protein
VAKFPRWLGPDTVLVARAVRDDDFSQGGRLDRISLADGKRTRVAKLPPFSCAGTTGGDASVDRESTALSIQDGTDFVVDAGKRFVCIELMDRNVNMASLAVAMRVDLETGKVERRLTLGKEECKPPDDVAVDDGESDDVQSDKRGCTAEAARPAQGAPASFPFTFADGALLRQGSSKRVLTIRGYDDALLISPSGRWAVLGGDQEDGDYIHRSLVLLDRATGHVFPIRASPHWPAPLLPASKTKARLETPIPRTVSVVGETDVRWLGTGEETELLVIDDLVVKPGGASFSVKGEIPR